MSNDDLGKGVAGEGERFVFGGDLILRFHGVGGLDVHLFPALGRDEVDLPWRLHGIAGLVPFERVYDPDIHGTPADDQLVIDDVLHDVRQLLLAEADAGIAQTNILAVVFVGVFEVRLSLHVVALALAEQECILQVLHVSSNGVLCHAVFAIELLQRVDGIGNIGGISQGTHRGAEQIQDDGEDILALDLFAIYDVLDINL